MMVNIESKEKIEQSKGIESQVKDSVTFDPKMSALC